MLFSLPSSSSSSSSSSESSSSSFIIPNVSESSKRFRNVSSTYSWIFENASKFASLKTLSNFRLIFLQHSPMACFLSSTELVSSSKPTFRKLFCADKVNAFSLVFLFLAFRRVKQDAFNASVVKALTLLSVVFAFVPPPFPPPSLCFEIIITFAFLEMLLVLFVVLFAFSSSSNTDDFSFLLLEGIICILRYPNE